MKLAAATFLILIWPFFLVNGMSRPHDSTSSQVDPNHPEQIIDLLPYWKKFDSDTKEWVHYNSRLYSKTVQVNVPDSIPAGDRTFLRLRAPEGSLVFFGGELINRLEEGAALDLSLDSLKDSRLRFSPFIVFHLGGLHRSNFETSLVIMNPAGDFFISQKEMLVAGFADFFVTASILIMIFAGFLLQKFPRDSADYMAVIRSLSFLNREEALMSSRPFNRTNILFILLAALVAAFLFVTMEVLTGSYIRFPFIWDSIIPGIGVLSRLGNWLIVSSIIFAFIFTYYLVINLLNLLFGLNEFKYLQFFNSIRYTLSVLFLCFLLTLVIFLSQREGLLTVYSLLVQALVILLAARMFFLYFKLRNYSSYRTFHLISYLCATELIPFILVLKMVVD